MSIDLVAIKKREKASTSGKFSELNADVQFWGRARTDILALIAEVEYLKGWITNKWRMETPARYEIWRKEQELQLEQNRIIRGDNDHLRAELKRHRELAKVVREIARFDSWESIRAFVPNEPSNAARKARVVELLKEVHDAQEG